MKFSTAILDGTLCFGSRISRKYTYSLAGSPANRNTITALNFNHRIYKKPPVRVCVLGGGGAVVLKWTSLNKSPLMVNVLQQQSWKETASQILGTLNPIELTIFRTLTCSCSTNCPDMSWHTGCSNQFALHRKNVLWTDPSAFGVIVSFLVSVFVCTTSDYGYPINDNLKIRNIITKDKLLQLVTRH